MKKFIWYGLLIVVGVACSTPYQSKPFPFRHPDSYGNSQVVDQVTLGGEAFVDRKQAREAFGFDIHDAGMVPVQIAFHNEGESRYRIMPKQTFLEDREGKMWDILDEKTAYKRATKYAETHDMLSKGTKGAGIGAAAGAIVGAAVGIVTGENVAASAGKGAAVGGAAGAVGGGASGYASGESRNEIVRDLQKKSLENKPIPSMAIAHGILFFPGEVTSAKRLHVQLKNVESGKRTNVKLIFPSRK